MLLSLPHLPNRPFLSLSFFDVDEVGGGDDRKEGGDRETNSDVETDDSEGDGLRDVACLSGDDCGCGESIYWGCGW